MLIVIKNISLNSQISYWNGQKKTVSREGLGMKGRVVSGSTRQIQTGAIINPNNAPPKISNLFSRIFLWSFMWKEGRTHRTNTTDRNTRYSRFYKHLSLNKIRENILWGITQTDFMNCEWQAESHKKTSVCI